MKSIILLSASTALFCASTVAEVQESRVTFTSNGQEVIGTLALPEGDSAPVVLLLHGFTGSRDELKSDFVKSGVFAHSASALAEAGFASLRIDFRGSGESIADLDFAQTTFEGQVADGIAAINYLRSINTVDSDEIHLIGWSQGGLVATAVAGRTDVPDAVALWAAVADAQTTFSSLFGNEIMLKGLAASNDQPVVAELPWGAKVSLNGAFFKGIESFKPLTEIKSYYGPLFVAQGLKDTTVLPQNADALIAAHDGPEQLWTAEMDHVFNAFSTSETLDQMIAETIAFFKANDD